MCLFNISHFCSINSLEAMSKKTQEDVGEERVTAKSKPMMNLVSRCSVRNPNVLASTASVSLEKTTSESQNVPLSSFNVQQTSTGRPVYDKFVIDDDRDSDTATESNFSLRSRSFLNRVNDRFRKMLDHRQMFYDLENVYVFDIGSISIHGKELLRQFTSHQNTGKIFHLKADVRDI